MKEYIVFYYDANKIERSIPVTAKDRFDAKFKAFDQHNISLLSISRVL